MSIYITKHGKKRKVNISATDVQLLDIDGRFKNKNLEDALKEVGSGTEENMTRIEKRVETLANPNILINGDFRKPINQRGQSEYNVSGKYSIDRWMFLNDNLSMSTNNCLKINKNYVSLCGYVNSNHVQFQQIVENPDLYMGKTISVSIKYRISVGKNTNNFRVYGRIANQEINNWLYNDTLIADGQWHVYTKTFTVNQISNPTSFIPIWISCINFSFETNSIVANLDEDCQIDLEYAKAEISNEATPFAPRSYGEELALCQRYYETCYNDLTISNGMGLVLDTTQSMYLIKDFQVEKRIIPTISIHENKLRDDLTGEITTYTSATFNISKLGLIGFYQMQGASLKPNRVYRFNYTADAELY